MSGHIAVPHVMLRSQIFGRVGPVLRGKSLGDSLDIEGFHTSQPIDITCFFYTKIF